MWTFCFIDDLPFYATESRVPGTECRLVKKHVVVVVLLGGVIGTYILLTPYTAIENLITIKRAPLHQIIRSNRILRYVQSIYTTVLLYGVRVGLFYKTTSRLNLTIIKVKYLD